MTTMSESRTLSVSIDRPPAVVYDFVSNPNNLPRWARGLCKSVRRSGAGWVVETPQGPMSIRFAEPNAYGVLDHCVTTASGEQICVPMRVVGNGSGSEVLFTLFRLPEMSEAAFVEDAGLVVGDLQTLKEVLERGR